MIAIVSLLHGCQCFFATATTICSSQSRRTPESSHIGVKSSPTQPADLLTTADSARTSVLRTSKIGPSREPISTQAKLGTPRPWK